MGLYSNRQNHIFPSCQLKYDVIRIPFCLTALLLALVIHILILS